MTDIGPYSKPRLIEILKDGIWLPARKLGHRNAVKALTRRLRRQGHSVRIVKWRAK